MFSTFIHATQAPIYLWLLLDLVEIINNTSFSHLFQMQPHDLLIPTELDNAYFYTISLGKVTDCILS